MAGTDLEIEALRRAFSDRTVGSQLFHYDLLGSTMDETRDLARQGAREGTVVIAEEQTKARGRFNRPWVSPRGQNLNFSVLLRPSTPQLPYVNMAATLAVARVVGHVTGVPTSIKWPNDVLVRGRKVSGILIESEVVAGEIGHAVVGIGVNVNFDPSQFPEITAIATSVLRETGKEADRTGVLRLVLEELDDLYREVKGGRSLTKDWESMLDTLGRDVQVRWGERIEEGRAESVDEGGNLVLVRADGTTFTAVAGDVTLLA